MANNTTWYLTIDGAFTGWFVGWYNQLMTPPTYSNYLRNCRLENQWICMRDWFRAYWWFGDLGEYIKLKATEKYLYALIGQYRGGTPWVYLYRLLPSWWQEIWLISNLWSNNYYRYDIVAIGECLLILQPGWRPYRYREWDWLIPLPNECMPSRDGGQTPNTSYKSTTWVYYSWFVFLNEFDSDFKTTNRIILSHEINRDTKDRWKNARDFSARKDADKLLIPYKIICPSAVQTMVSTQQNLYIFCIDSVQYLDKSILSEYATNKTLRTIPLSAGNKLMNRNLCTAAWNFVFFFCRDKHIRTLGYTSWIYDPQIADITDTQFWIQKRINDNVADEQPYAFAFFNKQDYTVEFHLKSKKDYWLYNDITLIRDLQHKQRLIDDWKHFTAMENYDRERTASNGESLHERRWVAHVVAWWWWSQWPKTFFYQCSEKYDTSYDSSENEIEVNPIEFEYNTTNIALGELSERKLFNWVRLTWAINIHTGNTDTLYDGNTALFEVNVYVDWKQVCNKKLNRQQLYDTYQKYQIEVGGDPIPEYDPEDRDIVLQYDNLLFPIDLVLDQGLVRRKWKRIRVQIKSATPGADLTLSWLSIRATPLGNFDLSDKF